MNQNTHSKNKDQQQWYHFTGIAGVAIGQIAVAMKKAGFKVTGSDRGLFPPMSDHLKENGIDIKLGYKPEHLDENGQHPNVLVMQGVKGKKNKEYLKAQKLGIPVKNFVDLIQEYVLVPESSIVVAGTYGKTTTTAMLTWIFKQAGADISYMFGGLAQDFENGVKLKNKDTEYSIIEGDEYFVTREIKESKFFRYNPKYLILTSAQWDHADIFETKEEYMNNFKKLVQSVPEEGVIIYNQENDNVSGLVKNAKCKVIGYDLTANNLKLNILGNFNKENAIAASMMAEYLRIKDHLIQSALVSFKGIKRRLEVKHQSEKTVVIDDFGASPSKAEAAIKAIKSEYPDRKLICIFEPNLGSRTFDVIQEYKSTFLNADKVYLPRFTRVQGTYFENGDLEHYIFAQGAKVESENDDDELLKKITDDSSDSKVLLFLGSHGFRGMIDGTISKLINKN